MKNAVLVPLSLYTIGLYNDHVNEETGLFDLQSFNHALTEHDKEWKQKIQTTLDKTSNWNCKEVLTKLLEDKL